MSMADYTDPSVFDCTSPHGHDCEDNLDFDFVCRVCGDYLGDDLDFDDEFYDFDEFEQANGPAFASMEDDFDDDDVDLDFDN